MMLSQLAIWQSVNLKASKSIFDCTTYMRFYSNQHLRINVLRYSEDDLRLLAFTLLGTCVLGGSISINISGHGRYYK